MPKSPEPGPRENEPKQQAEPQEGTQLNQKSEREKREEIIFNGFKEEAHSLSDKDLEADVVEETKQLEWMLGMNPGTLNASESKNRIADMKAFDFQFMISATKLKAYEDELQRRKEQGEK